LYTGAKSGKSCGDILELVDKDETGRNPDVPKREIEKQEKNQRQG